MNPAERNYDIYDKELLAIVKTLKEFRAELMSVENMLVLTDHKNLEYFTTTKLLNARQARWAEELAAFDFTITYRPGPLNVRADALTRRPQDLPSDNTLAHREQVMLPSSRFSEPLATILAQAMGAAPFIRQDTTMGDVPEGSVASGTMPEGSDTVGAEPEGSTTGAVNWQDEIAAAAPFDKGYQGIVTALRSNQPAVPAAIQRAKVNLGQCRVASNGAVFVKHRCWVPQHKDLRRRIVQSMHSALAAGHPGIAGTLDLIRRHFYWPKMTTYIRRFITHCRLCRTTRSLTHAPEGLLRPLPVPGQPWSEIAMDFVGPLPASKSFEGVLYENILTVTCRLTKERHLIPVKSMTVKNTARILCRDVFSKHGLPLHALSDRGPQFTSSFMRYAYKAFGVD
jgi:hypothetical protein